MRHLEEVVRQMRLGGYWDRVMGAGPELDRVKRYLLACAGEGPVACAHPLQRPNYPCFPGLRHRPWHDPRDFEAARILEDNFAAIREEAARLGEEARVDYSTAAHPSRSWRRPWTLLAPDPPRGTWTVYLFRHLGSDVEGVEGRCPRTRAVVEALPGACLDYAWGDFIFSAMNGGAHLRAHCSIDNLRVRLHLGIAVPGGCSIRVGGETRAWEAGRCLAFEDSFEHEVWIRSSERRVVLIADLWHPDLTAVETRALAAGFRKSQVRRAFMGERLGITDSAPRYLPALEQALARDDEDPAVREFWPP